jgi:hypothetical protein
MVFIMGQFGQKFAPKQVSSRTEYTFILYITDSYTEQLIVILVKPTFLLTNSQLLLWARRLSLWPMGTHS